MCVLFVVEMENKVPMTSQTLGMHRNITLKNIHAHIHTANIYTPVQRLHLYTSLYTRI